MNLKPELKSKWIEALTSGKYVQITDQLGNNDNGRCCLGVLCDILEYNYRHLSERGPDRVNGEVYAEISDLIGSDTKDELTTKNDGGDSFENIAKWIKENL